MAKETNNVPAGLITEKGDKYESTVSELDKARREYSTEDWEDYGQIEDEEIEFVATGIGLSNYRQKKDKKGKVVKGKRPYSFVEFFNDEDEEKMAIIFSSPFMADDLLLRPGHVLFDIVAKITGDDKSQYFKVDYKILQETLASIKSMKVKLRYEQSDKGFEWYVPVPVGDIGF